MTSPVRTPRALLMVVAIVVGGGPLGASGSPSAASAPRLQEPLTAPARQTDRIIGTSFEYGAFRITLGHAVWNPTTASLSVGIRFTNIGSGWAPSGIGGHLQVGALDVPFSGRPNDVPPGATVVGTGRASNVTVDPFPTGELHWGDVGTSQPVIRLDGRGGHELWLPTPFALDRWAAVGGYGVHATGGSVRSSQVDLGIQAPAGHRILRLDFDLYVARGAGVNGFAPDQQFLLQLPNGQRIKPIGGSPFSGPISWTQVPGAWVEFSVPEPVTGTYRALFGSMPLLALGTIRPELIVRRPIPFTIGALEVTPSPKEPAAHPAPEPPSPAAGPKGQPVDERLDVGTMNVPGFTVRPRRLQWDPNSQQATIQADVTTIETRSGTRGGALSAPTQFGFDELLLVGGSPFAGTIVGSGAIAVGRPNSITLRFSGLDRFDRDDLALVIGMPGSPAATAPLGSASTVPSYPPAIAGGPVVGRDVTVGNWRVHVSSYRLGFLVTAPAPRPGRRQLELFVDVTALRDAKVGALGLSFSAKYQVLLADPTGYDQQATSDSGYVEQRPGQTAHLSVTFDVPDSFSGGPVGLVFRSRSEVGDITTSYIEARVIDDIGTPASATARPGA